MESSAGWIMKNLGDNRKLPTAFRMSVILVTLLVTAVLLLSGSNAVEAAVEASFLHKLSNFSGPIPYNWVNVHVDKETNEIYVVDTRAKDVAVFNEQGMEIYRFADDLLLGTAVDLTFPGDGNILVLSRDGTSRKIIVCNFRGEPIRELELKDIPPEFAGFTPNRLIYRQGLLYLLAPGSLKIVVADATGVFLRGYDLCSLLGIAEDKKDGIDLGGFSVDPEGNILFTIPVKFIAYRLSPDGTLTGFGRAGGSPGRFNNIAGIVADDQGYYYVADKLKSAILVFDHNFNFQLEFGYRGLRPGNLFGPKHLALDSQGRLYVSQFGSKGVSVFKITHKVEEP